MLPARGAAPSESGNSLGIGYDDQPYLEFTGGIVAARVLRGIECQYRERADGVVVELHAQAAMGNG